MSGALALRANLWKLYLIQACRWFLLLMPVLVLFYRENGLSLQYVFIVQAFFSVCLILFEVPSGYFADCLGRRQSMIIGTSCSAFGFALYACAYSLPEFLAAQFFIALGNSFISGSDSALLYDTLLQLEAKGKYQKIAGRLGSIGNFSEGIAGIAGGLLALISLRTPLYYQAALMFLAIPLAWSLVEPMRKMAKRGENSFAAVIKIVRYALHGHAEVKWLILYSSLVGTSTLTIVWFVQPFLQTAELPISYFGVAWAGLQFIVGISATKAYRIEDLLGRTNAMVALILLSAASYLLLSQFQALWAGVFLAVLYLVRGINGPVLNDYINRCIESDIRATVLSVKALVGRLMFAALGPAVGWISDTYSLAAAFLVCGTIFLVCGLVFLFFLHRNDVL